jgi:AcrR family transcriptional regulator
MNRPYAMKKRAEQQADTRQRIVEATVELHGSVGPARTSFSMIAERAGVQRHTLYAHFPDERSLFLACSGLALERDPMPDSESWRAIADRGERLKVGLAALYAWYERNAELMACVLRDAEYHPPTQEILAIRFDPVVANYRDALGAGLGKKARALLALALSFQTWRTLAREGGLKSASIAEMMAETIERVRAR